MDHLREVVPRGEHFPRPVHIAYALDKALFRHPVQDGIEGYPLRFSLPPVCFFNPSSFISRSMSIRERTNISAGEKVKPGPKAVSYVQKKSMISIQAKKR